MSRPRAPLPADVLARLRVAAAEEFGSRGFEQASLNRILEVARVAKSSLYHHIGGKRALYDDLKAFVQGIVDGIQVADVDALEADAYWAAGAAALARLETLGAEHPEAVAIAAALHSSRAGAVLGEVRGRLTVGLERYLRRGRELGLVRRDVPLSLLTTVTVDTLVTIDAWAMTRASEPSPTEQEISAALRMVRRMLEGD